MRRKRVLALRPTQFAVGMLEVEEKIELVRKFGGKQRRAYVRDNPVPVIIAPDGAPYVIDHHHFLAVCYHVGIKKVEIRVVKDWSRRKMSYSAFWKWMLKNRHSYPFCQFGEGPRKALYLPRDIRGVADDPYRSLAWFVRKTGAFENSERKFAEFKWANYFRAKRLLDRHGMASMPAALVKASRLAQSHEARRLPGFDKLNKAALAEVLTKVKARRKKMEDAPSVGNK